MDLIFGDPEHLPHPVVGFGKLISWGEHRFNKGKRRMLKGAIWALLLVVLTFAVTYVLLKVDAYIVISVILVFYCLA